jgi:hypothetical protein
MKDAVRALLCEAAFAASLFIILACALILSGCAAQNSAGIEGNLNARYYANAEATPTVQNTRAGFAKTLWSFWGRFEQGATRYSCR